MNRKRRANDASKAASAIFPGGMSSHCPMQTLEKDHKFLREERQECRNAKSKMVQGRASQGTQKEPRRRSNKSTAAKRKPKTSVPSISALSAATVSDNNERKAAAAVATEGLPVGGRIIPGAVRCLGAQSFLVKRQEQQEGQQLEPRERAVDRQLLFGGIVGVLVVAVLATTLVVLAGNDGDGDDAHEDIPLHSPFFSHGPRTTGAANPEQTRTTTKTTISPTIPQEMDEALRPENPCDGNEHTVYVDEKGAKDFCNAALLPNITYALSSNIKCKRSGPLLSEGACLDCRGHSISGQGPSENSSAGIRVPAGADDSCVHNCAVENFHYGIFIEANDVLISNVETKNNGVIGIANVGEDNHVECSIVRNNKAGGVASRAGKIDVAASLVDRNTQIGIFLGSYGNVYYTEVRSNGVSGIEFQGPHENYITSTVVHGNGRHNVLFANSSGVTEMKDSAFCGAGYSDITVDAESDEQIRAEGNFVCDVALDLSGRMTGWGFGCFTPCPADDPAPPLPPKVFEPCSYALGTYKHR